MAELDIDSGQTSQNYERLDCLLLKPPHPVTTALQKVSCAARLLTDIGSCAFTFIFFLPKSLKPG